MRSLREAAHQQLEAWLDQLAGALDLPETPTLSELSALLTQTRGQLLGPSLQSLSAAVHAHHHQQPQMSCPGCGAGLTRKRLDP